MASLSLYLQFETNLMSNRKVIELLLQLKSAKDRGKIYIKVRPPVVRHLVGVIVYCMCLNKVGLLWDWMIDSNFKATFQGFWNKRKFNSA